MELFRKHLSKTDVDHRLAVPMHALETFQLAPGQYSKRIEAIGIYHDCVWSFKLAIRKGNDPNPRPEFRKGWKEFVQANDLAEGDTIVFRAEQNPAGETIYKIGGVRQKQLRLFGGNHIVYA